MEINNVQGVRADISEMLSKIREVSNKSKVFSGAGIEQTKSFDNVLSIAKNAISNVNHVQVESEHIKNSFVAGDGKISLSQVVLASQQSKLAFEGLVTVRNKILEAYKEIMNMAV